MGVLDTLLGTGNLPDSFEHIISELDGARVLPEFTTLDVHLRPSVRRIDKLCRKMEQFAVSGVIGIAQIPALMEVRRYAHAYVADSILFTLVNMGPKASMELSQYLDDAEVGICAGSALGLIGGDATAPLTAAAQSTDHIRRRNGFVGLMASSEPGPQVLADLLDDDDAQVRRQAAFALASWDSFTVLDMKGAHHRDQLIPSQLLRECLIDPSSRRAAAAAFGLGVRGGEDLAFALNSLPASEMPADCMEAGPRSEHDFATLMVGLQRLQSVDAHERIFAANQLADRGDPEAIRFLVEMSRVEVDAHARGSMVQAAWLLANRPDTNDKQRLAMEIFE